MQTTNYTELRTGLKTYLDTVVHNREPLVVNRPYNNSVVIISLEEYNALNETAYITSSPAMLERINSAEQNILNGNGIKINIDDLRKTSYFHPKRWKIIIIGRQIRRKWWKKLNGYLLILPNIRFMELENRKN